jgi:3-methyladenine DNA glycosylase AlkD
MKKTASGDVGATAREVLRVLERKGSKRNRDGMARYGIVAPKVFGVSVGTLRQLGKRLGRNHALAAELWKSGWYEARMLAAFVEEPERVTPAQMERWARAFDNWAICDTVCFHLFDKTPHAWSKLAAWADRPEEFVKRSTFALLASLSVHDKKAEDGGFLRGLRLVEQAADDERNFVKKAVSWALRSIGKRSPMLHAASLEVAGRLAIRPAPAARWVGKDALRELSSPAVRRRLAAREARRKA